MKIAEIKPIYFFSFFLILVSCNAFHKDSSNRATITGKITPHLNRNKVVYFYRYTDSLSLFFAEKKATDSCTMNPDGSFKLEISNWNQAGFFDLGTSEYSFAKHYFLSPGDDIKLFFIGEEMPMKLSTYQDIGEYNKFLQLFHDTFFREPAAKRNYFVISNFMLAPNYAGYINDRRNKQLAFYGHYFKDQEVDSTFAFYFTNETKYNWANDKTYFLWKKRTRNEFVPLDTSYFDFLAELNTDEPKALICPAYPRYINLLINELYQQVMFTLPENHAQPIVKGNLANQYLNGLGRKIAYHQILRDETTGINIKLLETEVRQRNLVDTLVKMAITHTGDKSFATYGNYTKDLSLSQ